MKKDHSKKLVLKKLTLTNLDVEKMSAVRGGAATLNFFCNSKQCFPTATIDGGCLPLTYFC